MKFSQRIGKAPAQKFVQRESLDIELRNSLWNAIMESFFEEIQWGLRGYIHASSIDPLLKKLWKDHFKEPVDDIPLKLEDAQKTLKNKLLFDDWVVALDLVEAFSNCASPNEARHYTSLCNMYLERESSAYRFVDGQLTEITSSAEIQSVESAIDAATPYGGAQLHLQSAISLMNDRANPDYRNSIKESISAVESIAGVLAGKPGATLGETLKVLERNGAIHPALKNGFSSLYGYTSDAQGIRHALLDKPTLQKADAIYMLVTCSGFVNYLISLADERDVAPASA